MNNKKKIVKLYELLGISYAKNLEFEKSKKYFDLALNIQHKNSTNPDIH